MIKKLNTPAIICGYAVFFCAGFLFCERIHHAVDKHSPWDFDGVTFHLTLGEHLRIVPEDGVTEVQLTKLFPNDDMIHLRLIKGTKPKQKDW